MQELRPEKLSTEIILQLAREQLAEIVINQQQVIDNQQQVIEKLNQRIAELEQEVERQKAIRLLDSKTSSKPPSTDILQKSEKKPEENQGEGETPKRKPGGQPGHPGKTRKGFDRIDRIESLRPQVCSCCGETEFAEIPINIEKQQVAQLSERPIEIVEYHRQTCICKNCGAAEVADWSPEIVPGQDIGVGLQAFLAWMNNYGHLSYEKQQELLWELGRIEIGLGTLVATNERIVNAIATKIEELKEWIQHTQPNIHVDETPWMVKGVKEWLWIFANTNFALFHAADTRGPILDFGF